MNPTTDADRAKGVLNGDPALESILTQLREAIADTFAGRAARPERCSQVGLSTGAASAAGTLNQDAIDGKLTLDTDQLSDALTTSFSDVKALFTNVTGTYDSEGLAQRLDDSDQPQVQTGGVLAAASPASSRRSTT